MCNNSNNNKVPKEITDWKKLYKNIFLNIENIVTSAGQKGKMNGATSRSKLQYQFKTDKSGHLNGIINLEK